MNNKWLDIKDYIEVFGEDKKGISIELINGFYSQERFYLKAITISDKKAYRVNIFDKTKWDNKKIKTHFTSFIEDSDRKQNFRNDVISLCKTIQNMGYDIRITHTGNTYSVTVIDVTEIDDTSKKNLLLHKKYHKLNQVADMFIFILTHRLNMVEDDSRIIIFKKDFSLEKKDGEIIIKLSTIYKIPLNEKWKYGQMISNMTSYYWSPTSDNRLGNYPQNQEDILNYQVDVKDYMAELYDNFIKNINLSYKDWQYYKLINSKKSNDGINIEVKNDKFVISSLD